MAHTKESIIKAENDFLAVSEQLIMIYAGKIQAIRNGMNAVRFGKKDEEEPLELGDMPVQERQTIKDLANKIAGNGQ